MSGHTRTTDDCSTCTTKVFENKYVGPPYCRADSLYAGRVARCPLVSHVEYAPRAILRLEKRLDRRTDGRTSDHYIILSAMDAASIIMLVMLDGVTDRTTQRRGCVLKLELDGRSLRSVDTPPSNSLL